jgi:hypothetical protein
MVEVEHPAAFSGAAGRSGNDRGFASGRGNGSFGNIAKRK